MQLLLAFAVLVIGARMEDITKISSNRIPNEDVVPKEESAWRIRAIQKLWDERQRMGYTPITQFNPPGFPNANIFFKNETATATRTLKHRFAWALLLWAISEGKVTSKTSAVYDSTSGNTGSAEAYMCTLVDIPYYAVVADNLEQEKVNQIESFGGKIIKVPVALRNAEAKGNAKKTGGFYMNQFGNAERAEEFHESGNFTYESSNVLSEILHKFRQEGRKRIVPDYFVHSAGTGGTISSVGRYIARYGAPTKVVLADSQYSLFYDYVIGNKFTNQSGKGIWTPPGIAGIGYGYDIEPVLYGETTSLTRKVIHEAMKMPDIATVASMRILDGKGYNVGPSTALNFLVSLYKAYQLKSKPRKNDPYMIVTLACDPGDFYRSTYRNDEWVEKSFKNSGGVKGMECWKKLIEESIMTGSDFYSKGLEMCPGNYRI